MLTDCREANEKVIVCYEHTISKSACWEAKISFLMTIPTVIGQCIGMLMESG